MGDSFSVKAILSAVDKGFTSTIKTAMSATDSLSDKIKNGFAFGVLTGAGQKAFGMLTNSATELVGEINSSNASWKTFDKNMQIVEKNSGKLEQSASSVKKELQDFAQKTIYSSSDMATTYAQLAAVGVKNTTKLVKGFGGLAAAAENPQQAMKTLSMQATQMAAKPKVAWADFKLMLEQTPAGISAVAKELGYTTKELVALVQDTKGAGLATDKFLNAIAKVGGDANSEFQKLAQTPKTVGQAMDGLKETVGNKLTPAFDILSQKGISAVDSIASKLGNLDATQIATKVSSAMDKATKYISAGIKTAKEYWKALKESFDGVGGELLQAFNAVRNGLKGAFDTGDSLNNFSSTMDSVASGIKKVANFVEEHGDTIGKSLPTIAKLAIAFKAMSVVNTVAPFLGVFAKGIASLAGKGIGAIAGKLIGIAGAQKQVGQASVQSAGQMLTSAKAFALMGVAVLAIAVGFGILAVSAISLAKAGPLAIGVMAGLVVALAGLGVGMAVLLKTLAPMSASLMPVATAMLALGGAVVLLATGFALLAVTAISLANAGPLAIGVMVGLVAVIALLAVGAAALGPALTAGSIGFIAFGAAIALVGLGALLAATALMVVSSVLPIIVAYGIQGAISIAALGASLYVFAAGATLAGVGCIALGAGLTVVALGLTLVGASLILVTASVLLLTVGIIALSAGVLMLGASLSLVGAALTVISVLLPSTAVGALMLSASFTALLALSTILAATLLLVTVPLALIGPSAIVAGAGMVVLGAGLIVAGAGAVVLGASLKLVNSSMKSISKNAKTTQKSLSNMQKAVKTVSSGLDAIGNKAKTAMNKIKSAFDGTAKKAQSSGKKVGSNFTKGLKSGLNSSKSVASSAVSQVNKKLKSGKTSAYSSGAYISLGFAQGMRSQLGAIQSAANKMVAAADKAIRAKAKIHSPSDLTDGLGNYFGQGWVNGILGMVRDAQKAAQKLVSIPAVDTPNLAFAGSYSGELSSDYDYYRNADYTIEVPLSVDGRKIAKATATYTQDELDKKQNRSSRKRGKV